MLLVTGASGFLGGTVCLEALASGRPVVGTVHRNSGNQAGQRLVTADLTDASVAKDLLARIEPRWVVNCAGFTNVDACEGDPERAELLNVELPRILATACAEAGVGFVHISTDAVFDGKRGNYSEDDIPEPLNVYAQTKVEGERAVRGALPEALVIRTNFIGVSQSGRVGLADWIASTLESGERVRGFIDVTFGPLLTNELARIILGATEGSLRGLYHAAAKDTCSKYEFACKIAAALGFDTSLVDRASIADAMLAAPRPLNMSLSSSRLEAALRRKMPSVDNAVAGYAALRPARYAGKH
jgi:dTDP-4-dehydrorhamnose reductase